MRAKEKINERVHSLLRLFLWSMGAWQYYDFQRSIQNTSRNFPLESWDMRHFFNRWCVLPPPFLLIIVEEMPQGKLTTFSETCTDQLHQARLRRKWRYAVIILELKNYYQEKKWQTWKCPLQARLKLEVRPTVSVGTVDVYLNTPSRTFQWKDMCLGNQIINHFSPYRNLKDKFEHAFIVMKICDLNQWNSKLKIHTGKRLSLMFMSYTRTTKLMPQYEMQ